MLPGWSVVSEPPMLTGPWKSVTCGLFDVAEPAPFKALRNEMFPPAPTVKAVVPLTRVASPAKVTFDWLVIVGLATSARVPLNVRSPLLETGDEVVT